MPHSVESTPRRASRGWRIAVATAPLGLCTGCNMLGAMFDEHPLGGIAFVVVAVAALGFLVSRGARRR
ncbi:hypothetical protein GCM10008101_15550 [Lysobacter xinjiangensis]|uniref:Mercuric ion transport protein n=1 Tax=Cognatilysobacter xinjiangensis TaxID=546892 RepID=A0ABQ3BZ34_9GAMM|nr:hypothetical protein [Lysobacter xinjiangensis]GGZ62285.1 hypothetical protein GCM10008101_15550 [Lysobacter xinjiangensis]